MAAWFRYWLIPSFGLVGLLFGVLASFLLVFGEPEYRLAPTASNLRIAIPAGFALWLFYSVLLWVVLAIASRLLEWSRRYYAMRHTKA